MVLLDCKQPTFLTPPLVLLIPQSSHNSNTLCRVNFPFRSFFHAIHSSPSLFHSFPPFFSPSFSFCFESSAPFSFSLQGSGEAGRTDNSDAHVRAHRYTLKYHYQDQHTSAECGHSLVHFNQCRCSMLEAVKLTRDQHAQTCTINLQFTFQSASPATNNRNIRLKHTASILKSM